MPHKRRASQTIEFVARIHMIHRMARNQVRAPLLYVRLRRNGVAEDAAMHLVEL